MRDPMPGTAAARARDFGIDLSLVIEQLRRTPEERVRRLGQAGDGFRKLKEQLRKAKPG